MPVYVIEFVTSDARPQQRRFTLDDDRPLRPQVEHVLAELERAGLVLRGGPADELAVRWAGHEVDAARAPSALGITPDRPVELRMQRRRAPVIVAPPPPRPEAPPTRFVPRSVYASAALGAAGAWAAWTAAGALADGGEGAGFLGSHAGLDGLLAILFGLLVGAAVGFGSARRTNGSVLGGLAAGAGSGLVIALLWAAFIGLVVDADRDPAYRTGYRTGALVIVLRLAVWTVLTAAVASTVALATARWTGARGGTHALRAGAWATLAGLVAGLFPTLPGPVELWSALGATAAGAGVGAAVAWAAARRAVGVLTLEAIGERGPGVVSLREWALDGGRSVRFPAPDGTAAPTIAVADGIVTQTGAAAGGVPRPVRQDDRLTVGAGRYRFRRFATLSLVLLAAPFARGVTGRLGAQSPDREPRTPGPIDRATLVRCVADRPLPCVQVRVTLPPAAAVRDALTADPGLTGLDDAESAATPVRATGWSGRLGPYTLDPVQVRVVRAGGPPRVVLTLVDVSGSMRGDGMQVARAAVRSFLHDLGAGAGPGAVQAALGSFASRNVVAGIRGVAFAAPETVAGNVDLLPPPGGNTGLYSAVAAGAARVAEVAGQMEAGARAALVIVTDGVNDVTDASGRPRADDDAGLLRGPEGRVEAAATARRLGVDLYLIGVGPEPDMNELQSLAGGQGRAFRSARDAVALRAALTQVDAALAPTRDVLFAVPGAERASLARPEWTLTVVDAAPARSAADTAARESAREAYEGRWSAPIAGTPVFAGAAFRADGRGPAPPPWLREAAQDTPVLSRRALVSLFVALLVAIVWALPRAVWQPVPVGAVAAVVGPSAGAVTDATERQLPLRPVPSAPVAVAAARPGGLAPDVRDAPPRRPEDVTAQRVRHNGTRPASMLGTSALPPAPPAIPRRP